MVLRTYAELDQFLQQFAAGKFGLLILVGRPGLQKSRNVRSILGPDVCWIESNTTAFGMYCRLFEHRDEPIVLDEVDSLYSDRAAVRLLKCLCQTEREKTVAWHSYARALEREDIPREFTTESRILIIANVWKTLNNNVSAIEDRGHVLLFEPSPLEVHCRTAEWFWDQEVYDFVAQHLHLIAEPSMCHYLAAWELKQAGFDWRNRHLERWAIDDRTMLVVRLKADHSYTTEEARVQAFREMGGGCRQTYFSRAKKIRAVDSSPRVILRSPDLNSGWRRFDADDLVAPPLRGRELEAG